MDDIADNQLYAGDGDGADIVLVVNSSLISVSTFPANGSSAKGSCHPDAGYNPSPGPSYLSSSPGHGVGKGGDEYDEFEDGALSITLDAGKSVFIQTTISEDNGLLSGGLSLHALLFPVIRYFHLEPTADHAFIVPVASSESSPAPVSIQSSKDRLRKSSI